MYIFCTKRGKSYHFRTNFSPNEVKEIRVYVDNICWNIFLKALSGPV